MTSKSTILNYNFQHDIKIRHFELIFNKGHQDSPFFIQFLTCDIRIHHFKLYFQQVTLRYANLNYNFLHVSSSSAILIYFFPLNIISLYNKIRHFEFLFLPRSTLNFSFKMWHKNPPFWIEFLTCNIKIRYFKFYDT